MKASRRHKLLATSETNCSAKESKVGGVESPLVLLNGRFFLFFGLLVLFRRFSLREELREGGEGGRAMPCHGERRSLPRRLCTFVSTRRSQDVRAPIV